MDTEKELFYKEYLMRENETVHAPYGKEFAFYQAVKNGNEKEVARISENVYTENKGFGKLSDNPLQNQKYHFAITVALVARYCIEGGMQHETAYNLSDLYIHKADQIKEFNELTKLHTKMTQDYTKRMRTIRKRKALSKPVSQTIEYIYDNLHKRIKLSELSAQVGISPNYLSRLFKNETGVSITEYIMNRKIETAQNMLRYSDYSIAEITSILAFPSQSYFCEVLKKHCGMTPKKYRDFCAREINITEISHSGDIG
ncbi:MAG TPA: AraC family transcriptional regulator [Bacillota bacterium]|nr:AraC family transcriptional regulator [Bacillota bacterium]HPE38907.1 AraC family transcriptional regulator [Bacillota bacterium]